MSFGQFGALDSKHICTIYTEKHQVTTYLFVDLSLLYRGREGQIGKLRCMSQQGRVGPGFLDYQMGM